MHFRDTIAGAAMVVLSLVLFIGTWDFSDVSGYMSPRIFPRLVAVVLFGFSAVLLVRAVPALVRQGAARVGIDWRALVVRYRMLAVLVAISFAYIYAMETVGYVIATILYIAVTVVMYGEKRRPVAAAIGIVGGVALYGLFRLVFDVPLPRFDLF